MKPTKILVPVDGSIPSKNAVKYAATLAKQNEAEITLLHVYGPISQLLTGEGLEIVKKELTEESEKLMTEYKELMEECGATADMLTRAGETGNVILNVADELGSDLIIMGSRGHTALEGIVMGSVAIKVLHGAKCPVLVTRNLRGFYPEHACFA